MSNIAKLMYAYNVQNLDEVRIYDASTYDTTPITDIDCVRFLFGNVTTINGVDTDVSTLNPFVQYIVTQGSITINGKDYTVDDYIYLANAEDISSSVTAGSVTVSETGFYGGIVTWKPSDGTYVAYVPSQMIYGSNSSIFSDNVFTVYYEQYGVQLADGDALANATQYIVKGTAGNSITYDSDTFYVGEVFTTNSTSPFTNDVGVSYVCPLVASANSFFFTWGTAWDVYSSYINKISTSYTTTAEFNADFVAVAARVQALGLYADQQNGGSTDYINRILVDIDTNYNLA